MSNYTCRMHPPYPFHVLSVRHRYSIYLKHSHSGVLSKGYFIVRFFPININNEEHFRWLWFSIFSTETKISETIVETWNNDKSCDAGLMEPRRRMCGWLQTLMPWMWQTRLGLSEDRFPIFRLDWAKSFCWYCYNFVSCIGLELQCNFSVWQCWRFLLWQWDCFWSPLNCHC